MTRHDGLKRRRPRRPWSLVFGSGRARRRGLWLGLALLLVAGQLELGACAPATGDSSVPGPWTALDGDTLRAPDGQRVRLPAVDTPERGRPLADAATDLSAAFVAGGDLQADLAGAPRDRYGRVLSDVRRDGDSLSARLVESGLAWVYEAHDPELLALQADAVSARRGVHVGLDDWAGTPLVVSRHRFHRRDCASVRSIALPHTLDADLAGLLSSGRSPCRSCLPWPPLGRQPIGG
jgi:endonuclease YncB( thermonuclease family)